MGSALTSPVNDLTLADIADLTDVFYIGGTKNGALLGEAVVILRDELKTDFRFMIKQRGAMMAKGWLLGRAVPEQSVLRHGTARQRHGRAAQRGHRRLRLVLCFRLPDQSAVPHLHP